MRWLGAIALLVVLAACQARPAPIERTTQSTAQPARGRARMWTQNCIRCHNARPPGYYSDREWQVAMHHMRVRCSITKQEYEEILSFLQSAN